MSFVPAQGSIAAARMRAARAAIAQNQGTSIRAGHVNAMKKAVSSPESVKGDPQYIALRQQINDITRTINRANIPNADKAALREDISVLESQLQAFIESQHAAPVGIGGRRRTRRRRSSRGTLKKRRA
jgi:hypothetical protein